MKWERERKEWQRDGENWIKWIGKLLTLVRASKHNLHFLKLDLDKKFNAIALKYNGTKLWCARPRESNKLKTS